MSDRYRETCERLGFTPEVNFVKLMPGGHVGFTTGRPDEIKALAAACRREGMRMSKALRQFDRRGGR